MGGRGEEVRDSRSSLCAFPGISLPQPSPSCSGPGKDKSGAPCPLTTTESSQGSSGRIAGPGATEGGPLTVAVHLPGPQLLQAPCPMGFPSFLPLMCLSCCVCSCICPLPSALQSQMGPSFLPQTHLCPFATRQLHFL